MESHKTHHMPVHAYRTNEFWNELPAYDKGKIYRAILAWRYCTEVSHIHTVQWPFGSLFWGTLYNLWPLPPLKSKSHAVQKQGRRRVKQSDTTPLHIGGSIAFARWCQCAPHSSTPKLASAPYWCCHLLSTTIIGHVLGWPVFALPVPMWASRPTWLPGLSQFHILNGILFRWVAFARTTIVTDRQTTLLCL